MVNKAKRITGLIGSIVAILLGTVAFICGVVFFAKLMDATMGHAFDYCEKESIGFIMMAICSIFIIIFGAIGCKGPRISENGISFRLGKKIVVMIFGFLAIIGCALVQSSDYLFEIEYITGYSSGIFALMIVMYMSIVALYIVSFCLKPLKAGATLESVGVKKPAEVVVDAPAYNPIRRAIELLAAVHIFIFGVYLFWTLFYSIGAAEYGPFRTYSSITAVYGALIGIVFIIMGILFARPPKFSKGKYGKRVGIKATVISLASFMMLMVIIRVIGLKISITEYDYYGYEIFIFYSIVMGYLLIAMNLPELKSGACAKQNTAHEVKPEVKPAVKPAPVAEVKPIEEVKPVAEEVVPEAEEQAIVSKPAPVAPKTAAPKKVAPQRVNGKFVKKTDK